MINPKLKELFTVTYYLNEGGNVNHSVMYKSKQSAICFSKIDPSLCLSNISGFDTSTNITHPDLYKPRGFLKNIYYRIKDTIFPLSYKRGKP